jgi:hypothetical protein
MKEEKKNVFLTHLLHRESMSTFKDRRKKPRQQKRRKHRPVFSEVHPAPR